jgi:hypothetical protein
MNGCEKFEEDYFVSNTPECGDTLMSNPGYRDGLIQFKINNTMRTISYDGDLIMVLFSSAPTSFTTCTVGMNWLEETDGMRYRAGLDITTDVDNGDTLDIYDLIKPGSYPYSGNATPEEKVTVSWYVLKEDIARQQTEIYTTNTLNRDATFEITYRSPVFFENGDSCAVVQGIFCCNVVSRDSMAVEARLQGNFSCKVRVY